MSEFIKKIVELEEAAVEELLNKKLESNEDPLKIMDEVREAMKDIGDKFQNKEYFLPDLIMSGEILRSVFEKISPLLKEQQKSDVKKGKILLGTVAGDIHDIGKDVVKFMLDANGFEVIDLGVDVPSDTFIEKIKEFKPEILALSGFLTLAYDSMKEIIQKITENGLRDSLKVMIGGGTVDENIVEYVKADAYGESAVDAINLAKKWLEGATNA
jgi:5-methyltetrahydrofolate--homocysteine methyltransferase